MVVRADLRYSFMCAWGHFARPGPTLSGDRRVELLAAVRTGQAPHPPDGAWFDAELGAFAQSVYSSPRDLHGDMVGSVGEAHGYPRTVEVIALTSMLASIDGTHRALGAELEALPTPVPGAPTGNVAEGLKHRRTHVPVPPGPIPFMLDLVPDEGAAFQAMFGASYMTGREMENSAFRRIPGLDRAQMELVSSRTSIHNECFY